MKVAPKTMLECDGLTITVADRVLVRKLNLAVEEGEFVCILGQNGAGKTLTLHTLAGIRPPLVGRVKLGGCRLTSLPRRATAQMLGLLMQNYEDPFPATVLEVALIGRHPHLGFWQWESKRDLALARRALKAMDLGGLESRNLDTLSGGERRRLAIAAVITQNPDIYLLDEPTNHLDPHHQLDVIRLFRERADRGKSVIVTVHDANLAARFADRVLLLFGAGEWLYGACNEVLTADNLSRLYQTPVESVPWKDQQLFVATGHRRISPWARDRGHSLILAEVGPGSRRSDLDGAFQVFDCAARNAYPIAAVGNKQFATAF